MIVEHATAPIDRGLPFQVQIRFQTLNPNPKPYINETGADISNRFQVEEH